MGRLGRILERLGIMADDATSARLSAVDDELNGLHAPRQDPDDETACEVCGRDIDFILLDGGEIVTVHGGYDA